MTRFSLELFHVTMNISRTFIRNYLAFALIIMGFSVLFAQNSADKTEKIKWLTWEAAMTKMDAQPRKVMVDVYTDWCGWCKRMDASTFRHPDIVQYVNDNYYAVKLDAEQKLTIKFKGKAYNFVPNGRRGYHELSAELMNGRMSYPTIVYLDEGKSVLQAIPGFKQAKDQDMILKYWGDNAYKEVAWETFSQGYESPITQ